MVRTCLNNPGKYMWQCVCMKLKCWWWSSGFSWRDYHSKLSDGQTNRVHHFLTNTEWAKKLEAISDKLSLYRLSDAYLQRREEYVLSIVHSSSCRQRIISCTMSHAACIIFNLSTVFYMSRRISVKRGVSVWDWREVAMFWSIRQDTTVQFAALWGCRHSSLL